MDMRRIVTATLALGILSAAPAAGQQTLINLGGDATLSFTGDDLDGLDNAFGFGGGVLFPMGPLSFLGFDGAWSRVGVEGSDENGSLWEIGGVARLGFGSGQGARPYLDIRAGYGRLAFDDGLVDSSVDGPMAGGGLGVMIPAGGVWIDLHGRYQHHWFNEAEVEGFLFDTDASGGRLGLGAAVNIPVGG